jgi:hypothetical protein
MATRLRAACSIVVSVYRWTVTGYIPLRPSREYVLTRTYYNIILSVEREIKKKIP